MLAINPDTRNGLLVYVLAVLTAAAFYPTAPLLGSGVVTTTSLGLTFAWAPVRGSRLRRALKGIAGYFVLAVPAFAAMLALSGVL